MEEAYHQNLRLKEELIPEELFPIEAGYFSDSDSESEDEEKETPTQPERDEKEDGSFGNIRIISDQISGYEESLDDHLFSSSSDDFQEGDDDDNDNNDVLDMSLSGAQKLKILRKSIKRLQKQFLIQELNVIGEDDEESNSETSLLSLLVQFPVGSDKKTCKFNWIAKIIVPVGYPKDPPFLSQLTFMGEPCDNIEKINDQFISAFKDGSSLESLIKEWSQIVESIPISNQTSKESPIFFIRDFAFDETDLRHFGKHKTNSKEQKTPLRSSDSERKIAYTEYTFEAELEGEMSVNKGDLLYIMEDAGNGWFLASKVDSPDLVGFVPENYVKIQQNPKPNPLLSHRSMAL